MCIMEVRKGQQSATMAQAMAHNLSTVERDLEMFAEVLRARNDGRGHELVGALQVEVEHAYRVALALFADELADHAGPPIGTDAGYMPTGLQTGNERHEPNLALLAEWRHEHAEDAAMIAALPVADRMAGTSAAMRAERFETR